MTLTSAFADAAADELLAASIREASDLAAFMRPARMRLAALRRKALFTDAAAIDGPQGDCLLAEAEQALAVLHAQHDRTVLGLAAAQALADRHARDAAAAEMAGDAAVGVHRALVLEAMSRLEAASSPQLFPVPGGALLPVSLRPTWDDVDLVVTPLVAASGHRACLLQGGQPVAFVTLGHVPATDLDKTDVARTFAGLAGDPSDRSPDAVSARDILNALSSRRAA
jgi:hypothetical protein